MKHAIAIACALIASKLWADPAKDGLQTLTVRPAAAPIPTLRYTLLPEVADQFPGNAVPAYLKAFSEQANFYFKKESIDERERYAKALLSEIKPGELKRYGGTSSEQVDRAARMEFADWNILPQFREKGVYLLIPEVQQMRLLSQVMLVRCKGELVDKDFAGAVKTLQTMFSMARHMGEHPTLISQLVGFAIANQALSLVDEFVQQPGAPNLYWALTMLPQKVVDIRRGISAERAFVEFTFGSLMDASRGWSADDIKTCQQKLSEYGAAVGEIGGDDRKRIDSWLRARLTDADWLANARTALARVGYSPEKLATYPPEQVVFYKLVLSASIARDEAIKWLAVPFWQAEEGLRTAFPKTDDPEQQIAQALVVAHRRIGEVSARIEQRVALLRIAEAIRMYAVGADGKVPGKLDDLKVPVPVDPVTGKPFEYMVEGGAASIVGKPSGPSPQHPNTYTIRIAK